MLSTQANLTGSSGSNQDSTGPSTEQRHKSGSEAVHTGVWRFQSGSGQYSQGERCGGCLTWAQHTSTGAFPHPSASEGQQNLSFSGFLALQPSGDESAVPLSCDATVWLSRQRAHNIDRSGWAGRGGAGHIGAKTGKHTAMRLDQGGTQGTGALPV